MDPIADYGRAVPDDMYHGVPSDPRQDVAWACMPPSYLPSSQPSPLVYRCQEYLLHDGTVTGHVAWDMIDPNDIAAAAFFRQVTLGQTYYGYAYQPVMDTPDNIAAQIAASGPLVARLSPAGW